MAQRVNAPPLHGLGLVALAVAICVALATRLGMPAATAFVTGAVGMYSLAQLATWLRGSKRYWLQERSRRWQGGREQRQVFGQDTTVHRGWHGQPFVRIPGKEAKLGTSYGARNGRAGLAATLHQLPAALQREAAVLILRKIDDESYELPYAGWSRTKRAAMAALMTITQFAEEWRFPGFGGWFSRASLRSIAAGESTFGEQFTGQDPAFTPAAVGGVKRTRDLLQDPTRATQQTVRTLRRASFGENTAPPELLVARDQHHLPARVFRHICALVALGLLAVLVHHLGVI